MRSLIFLIIITMTSLCHAVDFKGKRIAVASLMGTDAELFTMNPVLTSLHMRAYKISVPDWDVNAYMEKSLITMFNDYYKAKAHAVLDKTGFPTKIEFGFVGPSDDELMKTIASSEQNAEYLILVHHNISSSGAMVGGYGFKDGVGMQDAFTDIAFIVFDLVNDRYLDKFEVMHHKSTDFVRNPLKIERDKIAEYLLTGDTSNNANTIKQLVYADPFDGKNLISTYENLYNSETNLEEQLNELSIMVNQATKTVIPKFDEFRPNEIEQLRLFLYQTIDESTIKFAEKTDPEIRED